MDNTRLHNIEYLSSLITAHKKALLERVLKDRTKYITTIFENIQQPHNASAVMRSCDIFGVQDLHVIESLYPFQSNNAVAKGASKWLDIYRYQDTQSCFAQLKKDGYKIVVTTPHERGMQLAELPINTKIALLFGTEITGASDEAIAHADAFITIPMYGFTESFNISVSAALCLYELMTKLRNSDQRWEITKKESEAIMVRWLRQVLHIK